jgi:hypothetical protein
MVRFSCRCPCSSRDSNDGHQFSHRLPPSDYSVAHAADERRLLTSAAHHVRVSNADGVTPGSPRRLSTGISTSPIMDLRDVASGWLAEYLQVREAVHQLRSALSLPGPDARVDVISSGAMPPSPPFLYPFQVGQNFSQMRPSAARPVRWPSRSRHPASAATAWLVTRSPRISLIMAAPAQQRRATPDLYVSTLMGL